MPGPPLRRAYSQVGRVGFSFLQEKWKWLQIENEAVLITSLCILSVDVFCFIDSCTLSLMEWSAFMYIADDKVIKKQVQYHSFWAASDGYTDGS